MKITSRKFQKDMEHSIYRTVIKYDQKISFFFAMHKIEENEQFTYCI